jgi:hypothetical protein
MSFLRWPLLYSGYHSVTPVDDAASHRVLRAGVQRAEPSGPPPTARSHRDQIGDSPVMLADEMEGFRGPHALGGTPRAS